MHMILFPYCTCQVLEVVIGNIDDCKVTKFSNNNN